MQLFDSDNSNEIGYLEFDRNFKITVNNKIKIIFAPNGTCKTSIYKYIKNRNKNFDYIDYEELKDFFIKNTKKEIKIGASIGKIDNLNNKRNDLINNLNISNNFKKFDITNQAKAKAISNDIDRIRNDNISCIKQFKSEKLVSLFKLNEDQKYFLIKNWKNIKDNKDEIFRLEDIKNNYKLQIMHIIDEYIDNNECECPVCGTINKVPIKQIAKESIEKLSVLESNLWTKYCENCKNKNINAVKNEVNEILEILKKDEIKEEDIINFIICGADEENANKICKASIEINKLNDEISKLEKERDLFYLSIKDCEEEVKSVFLTQFRIDFSNVVFDDINKVLVIKLPRNASDYSTGEINIMVFITKMISYFGNDKECLICDDPISSYDIPNQYRIIYEITQTTRKQNKSVLIFTHNIDVINIANTQYFAKYEYQSVDKYNSVLFINDISGTNKPMAISKDNVFEELDDSNSHKKYIKALINRFNYGDNQIHEIFHYNGSKTFDTEDGETLTNEYFIDLIDNFDETKLENSDFINNVSNKIIYFVAIRVWLEKQLYDNCSDVTKINIDTFGAKIQKMYDDNLWKNGEKVKKKYLMSKKVMLNQNAHLESQKMPFYYILNLTLDDIKNEISEIKEKFQ